VTLTDEDLKRMGRGERWGMPADGHDYIAQMAIELLTARAALAVAVEALRAIPRSLDRDVTAHNTLAKLDAMGHGAAQGKANGDGDE
jgi:hypothetical protein